jgi:hypothetical protein
MRHGSAGEDGIRSDEESASCEYENPTRGSNPTLTARISRGKALPARVSPAEAISVFMSVRGAMKSPGPVSANTGRCNYGGFRQCFIGTGYIGGPD